MNDVQRNFKRQIKEIERETDYRWRGEEYEKNGKKYIRYYDVDGRWIKDVRKKHDLRWLLWVLMILLIIFMVIAIGLSVLVEMVKNN